MLSSFLELPLEPNSAVAPLLSTVDVTRGFIFFSRKEPILACSSLDLCLEYPGMFSLAAALCVELRWFASLSLSLFLAGLCRLVEIAFLLRRASPGYES